MSINSINSASNVSLSSNGIKKEENNVNKTPEQINDGEKKLALWLAAGATIAIAGIAFMRGKYQKAVRKGAEELKAAQEAKNAAEKEAEKYFEAAQDAKKDADNLKADLEAVKKTQRNQKQRKMLQNKTQSF